MKIYKIPENLKVLIFDIDGTLYTSAEYVFEQVDVQVRHWAFLNNMSAEEGRKRINDFRAKWSAEHEGKQISLGNTFPYFGIDIETSIKWRNELLEPEKFLKRDLKLQETLTALKEKFSLIAVTNNPVKAACRNLKALGVEDLITNVIGLDTCYKSKPSEENLNEALKATGAEPEQCLAIGDRYDIDLALPLEKGMGGILVDGVEDVYKLTEIL